MDRHQALRTLNVDPDSSQDEIKAAYRKMALELHPDKNRDRNEDSEFKKITEAYNHLKKNDGDNGDGSSTAADGLHKNRARAGPDFGQKTQWGAASPKHGKTPEEDWGRFTRGVEEDEPDFWKEYERKFWDEYNARMRPDGKNGEYEKAREPRRQPNLFVDVDKSKCIGCCSCEIIAPDVFEINKNTIANPKSSVINQRGAGVNKIMNAAETCPTKAISVDDMDNRERLYPH